MTRSPISAWSASRRRRSSSRGRRAPAARSPRRRRSWCRRRSRRPARSRRPDRSRRPLSSRADGWTDAFAHTPWLQTATTGAAHRETAPGLPRRRRGRARRTTSMTMPAGAASANRGATRQTPARVPAELVGVFRIVEEGEIGRPGVIERRDAVMRRSRGRLRRGHEARRPDRSDLAQRQPCAARDETAVRSCHLRASERAAARTCPAAEAERLGAVAYVLDRAGRRIAERALESLVERDRIVEAQRTERRIPDQADADRTADTLLSRGLIVCGARSSDPGTSSVPCSPRASRRRRRPRAFMPNPSARRTADTAPRRVAPQYIVPPSASWVEPRVMSRGPMPASRSRAPGSDP